ncbi:MAG TPA: folate-binding protein, partial [Burkholderiaceae bacterium]
ASADWAVWGLVGEVASDAPAAVWDTARHGEGWLVRLPDAAAQVRRYLLLQPSAAAAPALPVLTAADWDWLEVESGLAWVKSATVEAFVPQMLNLELLGGVNFQKGCYPGQEVVARSQYRGTIKRRTLLFALEGSAVVGQEIFHSADAEQPAGVVAAAATRDGQGMVLAEVKLAALAEGSLHLGAATGPMLLPRELPYTISAPE